MDDDGSNESIDWNDLFFDLKHERAILVLGPDFYSREGVTVKEQLYNVLTKDRDHGVLHFYPSNGIFLFKSEKYKTKAQKTSSEFYRRVSINEDVLQRIIELPFRMIINTTPDKVLASTYAKKNIEHQFDYFTSKLSKKLKVISEPASFYPLIFNLFGSIDSYESIVLDFEDIFDHLKALLNNINVSEVIRSVLNETDTYIFIGFQLEKWDTQLLFRYLNMKDHSFDDSKKNYTTKSLAIDANSELFFRQQFNLKYYNAPIQFLDRLHQKYFELCAQEDSELVNGSERDKVLEAYLSDDEIDKALNLLTVRSGENNDLKRDLILIKATYSRYNFLSRRRLESIDRLEIMRSQIRQSILDLVERI